METYAQALLFAIPFFVVLMAMEIGYGYFTGNHRYKVLDAVSSISSGLTNVIKDSLGLGIVLVSYPYLKEHLALMQIQATWAVWAIAFVAIDFAGYWNHRLSHKVNVFWNQHVIHHSSEEFNLACALRQSISNLIGYFPLLLLPAAFLGVPETIIAILAPAHLFAQFWYHTRHIGKMGWLEYVIVTPSQHRVHHAINPEYIDKNLGQVLCIWDRMFGTFQEELATVPPQYGVLKPAGTWNPFIINFQHLWGIIQDAWRTKRYRDKLIIWFMPTGWRPADVARTYPRKIIEDVFGFERYATPTSPAFNTYAIFQMTMTVILFMFMCYEFGRLAPSELLIYGLFLFLGIFGYTSLMDGRAYAIWVALVSGLLGIVIVVLTGDWFGLDSYVGWGSFAILGYCLVTMGAGLYFSRFARLFPSAIQM